MLVAIGTRPIPIWSRAIPIGTALFIPQRVSAFDPATAVAVASLGLSIFRMFSNSGPGIVDLLQLQMAMLKNISESILDVQRGITKLLENVDELKRIVRQLPEATVTELYRAKISGLIRQYTEAMQTYEKDRSLKGISYARDKSHAEMEQIARQIGEARSVLFGYRNEVIVPIVATALQAEIHCMIMVGERTTRIGSALASYRGWFNSWLDTKDPSALPSLCQALSDQLTNAIKKREDDRPKYENLKCIDAALTMTFGREIRVDKISGIRRSYSRSVETDAEVGVYNSSAKDLNSAGASIPSQFFEIRNYTLQNTDVAYSADGDAAQAIYNGISAPNKNVSVTDWPGFSGVCANSQTIVKQIMDQKAAENESFNLLRERVLSYQAFWVAALSSVGFCTRLASNLR